MNTLLILLLSILPHSLRAEVPESSNCQIQVQTKMKSGKIYPAEFNFNFKQKSQCEHTATLFTENFSPRKVHSKDVNYRWTGK